VNKPAVRKMTAPPVHCLATTFALADAASRRSSPTNIFRPDSTPAQSIYGLSLFVLAITAVVFVLVFGLLAYAVIKFERGLTTTSGNPRRFTAAPRSKPLGR
jgi:heme/copper-type cytochrome/quinol oxidase subunit 2